MQARVWIPIAITNAEAVVDFVARRTERALAGTRALETCYRRPAGEHIEFAEEDSSERENVAAKTR